MSLVQTERAQLSQPLLVHDVLQSLEHSGGPPLGLLQHAHALLYRGAQNQTQHVVQRWYHKC